MEQLREGLDYKLYQIYAWGGLALIVIYIVVAVLVFDSPSLDSPLDFLVTAGPLMVWFAGILLYWWWVFLFKGNKELEELAQTQDERIPGINSLKNWNTLHHAMAISGGNVEALIKNAKKSNRPIILWFGSANLGAIWICGFITLGNLGIIKGDDIRPLLYGAFTWIGLMLIATPLLLMWGTKTAEHAYLAPLGLAITHVPRLKPDLIGLIGGGQKLIPDGSAIVEGERYERLVHIETIDKYSLTVLQANLPEFNVISKEGKLTPDKNAPGEVVNAFKNLRKAKRWQGIEVSAGQDGIAVQRESKGTNMWLYDLWLAEYLLDKIDIGQT
jgi:hypothetical protein